MGEKLTRKVTGLRESLSSQQRQSITETKEEKDGGTTFVTGSTPTLRDENGNIILFEDSDNPGNNVERYDQFITVQLSDDVYDIEEARKAIDFDLRELIREKSIEDRISEFLSLLRKLLPDIPNDIIQEILRLGVSEQKDESIGMTEFDSATAGSFGNIISRIIELQNSNDLKDSELDDLKAQLSGSQQLIEQLLTPDGGKDEEDEDVGGVEELEEPEEPTEPSQEPFSILVRVKRFVDGRLLSELDRREGGRRQIEWTINTVENQGQTLSGTSFTPFDLVIPAGSSKVSLKILDSTGFKGWFKNDIERHRDVTFTTSEVTVPFSLTIGIDTGDNSGISGGGPRGGGDGGGNGDGEEELRPD